MALVIVLLAMGIFAALMFYSETICTWRISDGFLSEEMFDKWYVTKIA